MGRSLSTTARRAGATLAALLLASVTAHAATDPEPRLPPAPTWHTLPSRNPAPPRPDPESPAPPRPDAASPAGAPAPAAERSAEPRAGGIGILPDRALPFDERCHAGGVVLCDPLDDGRVRGERITNTTRIATLPEALRGRYRDWRWCHHVGSLDTTPALDHEMKTSGTGSLRFTIPTRSAGGDSGYCQINFTPDNVVQFGEGEAFFVQFRVRFSCTLIFVDCDPASPGYRKQRRVHRSMDKRGTNFKVSIINAGDHPSLPFPVSSCTLQHLVLVQGRQGIVSGYHSCGYYDNHEVAAGQSRGSTMWDRQPKRAEGRPCFNRSAEEAAATCVQWPADEWVTVTQQVSVGKWAGMKQPERSSVVRIWTQRAGEAPVLVIDHARNLSPPEKGVMKYGKIWLLPYMTDKDPREDHPEAYMWFDELIVSRNPIAPAFD